MSGALEVEDLHVRFRTRSGPIHAVNGASFAVAPGEIVGLVGESGCGKSVTARAITRLEEPGEITAGSIRFDGDDLTAADDRTLRRLRGRELAMVFQDPSTTLNPAYPIGEQIAEALRVRRDPDRQPFVRELAAGMSSRLRSRRTRSTVLELLETVGIARPEARIDDYPHQFSGGMRQRVMLAIALARRPSLLIADEPTTALDTTTQAAILDRLAELNDEYGTGMLVISHDLGVVSELCDRIVVMYDGVVVEQGPTERLRSNPAHPYTKALLGCLPHRFEPGTRLPTVEGTPPDGSAPPDGCAFADRCPFATEGCHDTSQPVVSVGDDHTVRCSVPGAREASLESLRAKPEPAGDARDFSRTRRGSTDEPRPDEPVVELEGVTKTFRQSESLVDRLLGRGAEDGRTAVRDLSLELRAGETVGLVGESGCGKSTLAQLIAGLETPTAGTVRLRGERVGDVNSRTAAQRSDVGFVFQNPGTSLDPKRTVAESIADPLSEAGWKRSRRRERVTDLLSLVDLPLEYADRYPGQLSGGQRQRVAIARALALDPAVLVLDEPTAALDVSTQARILNLLADLQDALGFASLFVSHDLDVVRHVADRIAVMYLGRLVEVGPATRVFSQPTHPYTHALLDAIPGDRGETDRALGSAEPPDPASPPDGCSFHSRCPIARPDCSRTEPALESIDGVRSRCLYATAWSPDDRNGRSSERTDVDETRSNYDRR
ncbi:dipeptide ABC transporter ATP-binding protein [Halopiger djelfimassiliensis]|uniref:dipeptide ABC transporter ATP-binding protein n=1 Tax=Halopiger djelfimassiliensis TaxID=1293047 RepID=UPI0006780143|nr:ABC transporter ATP-binding protein [Halopiger djelfimassiliensis]